MLKIGIAGMPNAGKSTLFNALSHSEAIVATYPFSTIDTNKAMMNASDPDFEELGAVVDAPDLKYSQVELWDIAGLIEGASQGEGLGNEFLGRMKNCDVLLHVVRVTDESTDKEISDRIAIVNKEIALFDHHLLSKPFQNARRHKKLFLKDSDVQYKSEVFTKAYYGTRDGVTIREALPDIDPKIFDEVGLVSLKEQLIIANVDASKRALQVAKNIGASLVINAEDIGQLQSLSNPEQKELGYSGEEVGNAIQSLIAAVLKAVQMKQFYTVGHLGVGQWIVPQDFNAQQCARQLHEDMENEVNNVKVSLLVDFKNHKSWQALAKEGKTRTYSARKYIPTDKDVLLFD